MLGEIMIFVSGMVVGNLVGFFVLALVVASGDDDRREGMK